MNELKQSKQLKKKGITHPQAVIIAAIITVVGGIVAATISVLPQYTHLSPSAPTPTIQQPSTASPQTFNCIPTNCVGPALQHYCGSDWVNSAGVSDILSHHYIASNGSIHCNDATWDDHSVTQNRNCDIYILIPGDSGHTSTATLAYGFFDSVGNNINTVRVNEGSYGANQWVNIAKEANVHHVYVSDQDGQSDTTIGVSAMGFTCQ